MTLQALAEKYGCDKLHIHSYIPFYEGLFQGREVKRLLEIGIGYEDLMKPFVPFYVHGASLKMWEEYFPEAEIFGCDIREDTLINEGRIHSFVCDQSSSSSLLKLMRSTGGACRNRIGHFDVIIDDGSHQAEHQITSARVLLPYLNRGGVYIIEDVQDPDTVTEALGGGRVIKFSPRGPVWDDTLVLLGT